MSDSCCGGCGGQAREPKKDQPAVQAHEPKKDSPVVQAHKPEQVQKQDK